MNITNVSITEPEQLLASRPEISTKDENPIVDEDNYQNFNSNVNVAIP